MRMRKPYVAKLHEVKISRQGEHGVIEYLEPNGSTTYLRIGPEVESMSDKEILDKHNEILRIQRQMALEYQHVAIEIPPGHPQIEYHQLADQWTPRGDVLRCVIDDGGPDGGAVIYINRPEVSPWAFARPLTPDAGWG